MAYRNRRNRRYGRGRFAGRVARRVARRSYRGAIRMPKRRLARVYATKTGQVAYRAVRTLGARRARRYGKSPRYSRRRYSRRY